MKRLILAVVCFTGILLGDGCADKPAPVVARDEGRTGQAEGGTGEQRKTVPGAPAESGPARPRARYEDRLAKLLTAAEKGQVSVALEAITEGANINDKDEAGETALMKAAAHGHAGLVGELLARGAEANEKDRKGQTALMRAAESGNVSILKLLMAGALVAKTADKAVEAGKDLLKGAGVNLPNVKIPSLGDAALGATELDLQDSAGQTALMKAAAAGQVQTLQLLIQANRQSSHLKDTKGQTALTHAILRGSPDCVAALLWGPDLTESSIRDNGGDSLLSHAVVQGSVDICRALLAASMWTPRTNTRLSGHAVFQSVANNQGETPLMKAAAKGRQEIVQLLLQSFETDHEKRMEVIGRKDNNGKSAEQLADAAGHKEIVALIKGYTEAFTRDATGFTGLIKAAAAGDLAKTKALLAKGADVAVIDNQGQTSLMHAAAKGHAEVLDLLLRSFAANNPQRLDLVNLKDKTGKTAAQLAEAAGHQTLAALLKEYTDFDAKDEQGVTPLMRAAAAGDKVAVEKLLAKGADPTAKDAKGMTPLMHAAQKGQFNVISLVGPKTDDLRDNEGRTALMHAAESGHLDAARAIVEVVQGGAPLDDAIDVRHGHAHDAAPHVDPDVRFRLLDDPARDRAGAFQKDLVREQSRWHEEHDEWELSQGHPQWTAGL
jgi:serine/threonine-protein phosphatase 6 regulatory ankyrin repeat subunit B